MDDRPTVNASPLIFLARSGLVDLLQVAGPEIVVPSPVAAEINQRGPEDPTVAALANTSWLVTVEAPPTPALILTWDLGDGESAVLAWAHAHPGAEVILDDLPARRCAAALGIPVRGTLGLVLVAKQRGLIREARPVMEELRRGGMYLSDSVLNQALKQVGE